MRQILAAVLFIPMLSAREIPFFIGTYSAQDKQSGIFSCTLDSESGAFTDPVLAADLPSPSFVDVSADGPFLFAACEQASGAVAAFQIRDDRKLVLRNTRPSGGEGTCHVSSRQGHVLVSNYSSGNVSSLPVLADGSLGEASASVAFSGSGPHPTRQKKPYAHAAVLSSDARFAYVCDLGTDQVRVFRFDAATGAMEAEEPGSVPPGHGPRHLVFSPKQDFLYVNNEMGLSVSVFERDPQSGALRHVQAIPTLPENTPGDGVTTSGIGIHPDGRWLYVSNRGHNSISIFEVLAGGQIRLVGNSPATVDTPREFSIDPGGTWLVVAGQRDGVLASLKINPADGSLTPVGRVQTRTIPVSIAFVPPSR